VMSSHPKSSAEGKVDHFVVFVGDVVTTENAPTQLSHQNHHHWYSLEAAGQEKDNPYLPAEAVVGDIHRDEVEFSWKSEIDEWFD
jgi:hypothetical protein